MVQNIKPKPGTVVQNNAEDWDRGTKHKTKARYRGTKLAAETRYRGTKLKAKARYGDAKHKVIENKPEH